MDETPVCTACGWLMEWHGEMQVIELEGGMVTVDEPVYRCYNPQCEYEDDDPIEDECPECNWIGVTDKGYCRFCHADICSEIFD